MASEALVSTLLQECLERQRTVLDGYITTVDGLIAVTLGHESAVAIRNETTSMPAACVPVLALMLQAAGSSSHTIFRLSDRPGLHTRDCFSVARSVVELAANICYIIASGPEAAERASRHARQKSFTDLNRESKIGSTVIKLTIEGAPDPSAVDGLQEEIEEFTSRAGREKGWVDLSLDDRIAAVGTLSRRAMTTLHWARFAIYRHSSEVLHGTFFSALYFFGLTNPSGAPRTLDEMQEALGQQHMLLLMATTLALSAVIQSFHAAYGFQAAQDRDDTLMHVLRTIPLLRDEGQAPS